MIILACDGCGTQSPNAAGERDADEWMTVTCQSQRQRNRDNQGVRVILCQTCLPRLGNDLPLEDVGVDHGAGHRGHHPSRGSDAGFGGY